MKFPMKRPEKPQDITLYLAVNATIVNLLYIQADFWSCVCFEQLVIGLTISSKETSVMLRKMVS